MFALQKSKQIKSAILIIACLFFFFINPLLGDSFFSKKTNFSNKSPEEVANQVKDLNSKLTKAQVQTDKKGYEFLIMQFDAGSVIEPLFSISPHLPKVLKKIHESEGSERFSGYIIFISVNLLDKYNQPHDLQALQLYWSAETLNKINWKGFGDWQLLGLIDSIKLGPAGSLCLKEYCQEDRSFAQDFCQRAASILKEQ